VLVLGPQGLSWCHAPLRIPAARWLSPMATTLLVRSVSGTALPPAGEDRAGVTYGHRLIQVR
jgi:hypothetical protein